MFNPLYFYEAGKTYISSTLFPFMNSNRDWIGFSTRRGGIRILKEDGTPIVNYNPQKNLDFTSVPHSDGYYIIMFNPAPFTGNIKVVFLQGFDSVYSWSAFCSPNFNGGYSSYNIQDIGTFLKPFGNLYSIDIELRAMTNGQFCIVKGDFADIPESVERIRVIDIAGNPTWDTLFFDLSRIKINSKLKWLQSLVNFNIKGDLVNLPNNLYYFYFPYTSTSLTYSGGKLWATSFDTFLCNRYFTIAENDLILNDMAASITTAIGNKLIVLHGFRSSASDSAVTYLRSLGFTLITYKLYQAGIDTKSYRYIRDFARGNNINNSSFYTEIQVFNGTVNIASGITTLFYNKPTTAAKSSSLIPTDGNLSAYYQAPVQDVYAQIDLGVSTPLSSINVRHFSGRITYGTRIAVSNDGQDWIVLHDATIHGTYTDTSAGKTVTL